MSVPVERLRTHTWRHGGDAVLSVRGELDYGTARQLELELSNLVEAVAQATVVLDLHDLDFCDSSGLAVFVSAHKQADSGGGRLALAGAPERLRRMLTRTGLVSLLAVHETVSAALARER